MTSQNKHQLALRATLAQPYTQAVARVIEVLKEQGFGVLTQVDVKATLKKKLDIDFREYVILGVCNPPLAHQALTTTLDAGLLLPCNVVVYADGEVSQVAVLDPLAMLGVLAEPELLAVAQQAFVRLQYAMEMLTS